MITVNLTAISVFTICWYWSSSINSIYTQRLFQHIDGLFLEPDKEDVDHLHKIGLITQAIWLTSSQLFVGSVISGIFLLYVFYLSPSTPTSSFSSLQLVADSHHMILRMDIILPGILHCIGCLFTNAGFGYGSASLVQIIKLLEPIETLILTALHTIYISKDSDRDTLHQRLKELLPLRKVGATCIIVFGTSLLLANTSVEPNFHSIIFALGSGFCMAARNVAKKQFNTNKNDNSSSKSTFKEMWQNGMINFCKITMVSFVPSAVILLLALLFNHQHNDIHIMHILFQSSWLIKTCVFHSLYNMASITVLSLTSAPVHSLFNVGKRIVNVLTSAIAFSSPLHTGGKVGILFAGVGAILYNEKNVLLRAMNSRISRRVMVYLIVCLFGFNYGYLGEQYTHYTAGEWQHLSEDVAMTTKKKFVVWMYPLPPPSTSFIDSLQSDEVLICPYSRTACQGRGISINLLKLTEGSFYHPYITDHSYQKLRHFLDFAHHIQAIAVITLLNGKGM